MELLMYLDPAFTQSKIEEPTCTDGCMSGFITSVFNEKTPIFDDYNIVIIGVPEYRFAYIKGNYNPYVATDKVRAELYKLYPSSGKTKILDLGNMKPGETANDSLVALQEIVEKAISHKLTTVIIGGTVTLATSAYTAMANMGKTVSITSIDPNLCVGADIDLLTDRNYIGKMVVDNGQNLFNYTNIGYQGYFVQKKELKLLNKLYFEAHRLGNLRKNMAYVEPILRDTDLAIFNLSAVKQADSPASIGASPNGIYAEDLCQLAMYSGISDRTSCFGIYGLNGATDNTNASSVLAAQTIWHFIDGFYRRQNDFPVMEIEKYTKFIVNTESGTQNVVFYKNDTGERWWMEVPVTTSDGQKLIIVSCSYNDYKKTCEGLLPDRWWTFFNKVN